MVFFVYNNRYIVYNVFNDSRNDMLRLYSDDVGIYSYDIESGETIEISKGNYECISHNSLNMYLLKEREIGIYKISFSDWSMKYYNAPDCSEIFVSEKYLYIKVANNILQTQIDDLINNTFHEFVSNLNVTPFFVKNSLFIGGYRDEQNNEYLFAIPEDRTYSLNKMPNEFAYYSPNSVFDIKTRANIVASSELIYLANVNGSPVINKVNLSKYFDDITR